MLEYEARNCTGQVLRALDLMHNQLSLVHADVKPHNLLLYKMHGRFIVRMQLFISFLLPGLGI